ncbi:VPA1269 family protein [Paraburkholderia sp. RL17-373-BIF-A]|uniref:VPA1269 family protein n=1 Tax=Paraburkholderia sp. RL17-373-BIF-A TaxID=3031629 RepID=UPI0038B92261
MTVHYFKAIGSGKDVAFNDSEAEFALLIEPTNAELHEAIAEFESKRIDAYWEDVMLKEPPSCNFITAFRSENETSNKVVPGIYKARYLAGLLATDLKGRKLVEAGQNMPIEQQRYLVRADQPSTRAELQAMLDFPEQVIAPDFHALLDSSDSPREFVEKLVQGLWTSDLPAMYPVRHCEMLTLLWERGWFLFPHRLRDWSNPIKWPTLKNQRYSGSRSGLIASTYVMPAQRSSDLTHSITCTFFATTNVASFDDLPLELIDAFAAIWEENIATRYSSAVQKKRVTMVSKVRRAIRLLRQNFNLANPEHAIELKSSRKGHVAEDERRLDGEFRWLSTCRPELIVWSEMFRAYIKSLKTARVRPQIGRLNSLGDFLVSLKTPPIEPKDVNRQIHIYDATLKNPETFFEFLQKKSGSSRRLNDTISTVREFFDWLRDYMVATGDKSAASLANPISSSDTFGRRGSPSKTARDALPPYIIEEMKQVLLDDDFAFPRTYSSTMIQVRDAVTNANTRVFDPGLAVCLYVLFDTPIRSHQARWLDSGFLDEKVYDPASNSLVRNSSSYAVKGRKEGALRLQHDGLRAESWLTLWVNTNKTAPYDSPHIGYPIPYVSSTLVELLLMYLEWQKRYLPVITKPLDYRVYQADVHELDRPVEVKGPQITPLFRDPSSADLIRPIEYTRLTRFYVKVLQEVQTRIEAKYGQRIALVENDGKGGLKWLVDLHSLRVSGISNLIEAGVPLEVVSMFVAGHQTLIMTLHYLKYSPAKLRKFILEAHERMVNDQDFVGSELFTSSLDELAPYLIGQEGAGVGPGFRALQERTGIMTITSEGICPGTSCSLGGPLISVAHNTYAPVPGGKRCGLCRFWMTGPAHLLGQVTAVNNLAFLIRKKGLELAAINDARLDAEDSGNKRKARELRDRADILNRELEIDANEWVARYRYAERSVALMDDYLATKKRLTAKGANVPVPVLTSSSGLELRVTLEQAHEFELLDQITQMSSFSTGFSNREAELEKNAILSKLMTANDMKPFLLNLNDEHAHEAGNLLSSLILQQVRGQKLDDLLSGKKLLKDYPRLAKAIKLLEENATPEALSDSKEMSRLVTLVGKAAGPSSATDEEELFA